MLKRKSRESIVGKLTLFVILISFPFLLSGLPNPHMYDEEPVIYLTLYRWENRSFPPRLLYDFIYPKSSAQLQRLDPDKQIASQKKQEFFSQRSNWKASAVEDTDDIFEENSKESTSPRTEFNDRLSFPPNPNLRSSTRNAIQQKKILSNTESEKLTFSEINFHNLSDLAFKEKEKQKSTKEPSEFQDRVPTRFKPSVVDKLSEVSSIEGPHDILGNSPSEINDGIRTIDLTLEILRASNWGNENAVFSPFSIANILALLLLGSSGKTFNELSTQLTTELDEELTEDVVREKKFHNGFQNLIKSLSSRSVDKVSLEIANEVFSAQNYKLRDSYISDAQQYYDAPVSTFNFFSKGEEFKEKVNEWVRKKTRDRIKSIIESPPAPSTTLALINAVYFQGAWQNPFPVQLTRSGSFYTNPKEPISVKMMTNILTTPYIETDAYQMIVLPYKDCKIGFFIVLPKIANGVRALQDLERSFTVEGLTKNINSMVKKEVTIKLPKMMIESSGHMKDILIQLGLKAIFNPNEANFSRISDEPGLYVTSLLHRAVLDVNEKGTEASAVSAATGDRNLGQLPISFNANRPFAFFIYDIPNKTMLFWGRVTRPQFLSS